MGVSVCNFCMCASFFQLCYIVHILMKWNNCFSDINNILSKIAVSSSERWCRVLVC